MLLLPMLTIVPLWLVNCVTRLVTPTDIDMALQLTMKKIKRNFRNHAAIRNGQSRVLELAS